MTTFPGHVACHVAWAQEKLACTPNEEKIFPTDGNVFKRFMTQVLKLFLTTASASTLRANAHQRRKAPLNLYSISKSVRASHRANASESTSFMTAFQASHRHSKPEQLTISQVVSADMTRQRHVLKSQTAPTSRRSSFPLFLRLHVYKRSNRTKKKMRACTPAHTHK